MKGDLPMAGADRGAGITVKDILAQVYCEHSKAVSLRKDLERLMLPIMADAAQPSAGPLAETAEKMVGEFVGQVRRHESYRQAVLSVLSRLDNERHRDVLVRRYVYFESPVEIAAGMRCTERNVKRLHASALENFGRLLAELEGAEKGEGAAE